MADNKPYTFHFKEEVENAFAMFPELRRDTVFIDAAEHDDTDAYFTLHTHFPKLTEMYHKDTEFKNLIKDKIESARRSVGLASHNDRIEFILIDTKARSKKSFTHIDHDKFLFMCLQHELGHHLVADAHSKDKHYAECAADAFATIRFLQEFEDIDFIKTYMKGRVKESLKETPNGQHITRNNVNGYMTTRVIEAILQDDLPYKQLNTEQTLSLAAGYADTFMFDEKEMKDILTTHKSYISATDGNHVPTPKTLYALAQTTFAAADQESFRIGAYLFNAYLHPDGVEINGQNIKANNTLRIRFQDDLIAKAQEWKCEALYRDMLETKGEMLARENFPDYKHKKSLRHDNNGDNYKFDLNF